MSLTPKEKAEELVNNYTITIDHDGVYWNIKEQAKQCALIAVDEISKELRLQSIHYEYLDRIQYYCDVKSEIEKL